MQHTMERWYSASGQRFSMRRYAGAPDAREWEELERMAEFLCGAGVRLVLGRQEGLFRSIFLGSGKVRGTDAFAALIQGGGAELPRCGYVGESFVLECSAMGLGSCWLGGTYKKNLAVQSVALGQDERLVCVIAVGKPGESYVGRPRKSLCELTGLNRTQLMELPEWQQHALSCARLAPSALNAQPWRFLVEGESLAVERKGANFGFGALDQGIAMLHMELGASHAGVAGLWKQEGERAVFAAKK